MNLYFLLNDLNRKYQVIYLYALLMPYLDLKLFLSRSNQCPKFRTTVSYVVVFSNPLYHSMLPRDCDVSHSKHCVSSPSDFYLLLVVPINDCGDSVLLLRQVDQHNVLFRQLYWQQMIKLIFISEVFWKLFQTDLTLHLL